MNLNNLQNFQKILVKKGLDGFVVTNPTNIFYLCNFKGAQPQDREGFLVFSKKATLVTARIYQKEARSVTSKALKLKIAGERNEMLPHVAKLLVGCQKVGFEANDLTYAEYLQLKKVLKNLVPTTNLIDNMRIIKTPEEIKKIDKAQEISQKTFWQLLKTIKIGQTEEEIASLILKIIKSYGGQGIAFETIIASGPNSGTPHHITGGRKLKKHDILLLDFGAKYQNYMGDLSRTIVVGRATIRINNIYNHVLKAQQEAIKKIKVGMKSKDIYHVANNYFKTNKIAPYFLHGLGHGVGLAIHEPPILRQSINIPLAQNMVFSVEPGLYFPWGGVRIEDLVTIKNGHAKTLGVPAPNLVEINP